MLVVVIIGQRTRLNPVAGVIVEASDLVCKVSLFLTVEAMAGAGVHLTGIVMDIVQVLAQVLD